MLVNTHQGSLLQKNNKLAAEEAIKQEGIKSEGGRRPSQGLEEAGIFECVFPELIEVFEICPSFQDPIRLNDD